jgi:arylsulfatase A-like enzyme
VDHAAQAGSWALAACAVLLGAGCTRREPAPANLLIVTIDTLRRDHVGFLGADPSPTPALDALAREAVVFEDAYSVAPITLPAHTSLLSGLYPATHGVRDNGAKVVPSAVQTLAERLKARGYRTLASVSAFVLDPAFGLDQGFERYRAPPRSFGGVEINVAQIRAAEAVARLAAELERLRAESPAVPWFAWLHLYDPHAPYDAPGAPRELAKPAAYREEVRYADRELGGLFELLHAHGWLQSTVVVVTSDHGEGLADGPEKTHGYFVHDPTMRIPLFVRAPGLAPRRVAAPVSLVDLAPTLLGLLAIPANPADFDGIDLALRAEPFVAPPERTLLLESYLPWISHGWAPFEAGVRGAKKAIHSRQDELYDRLQDPREEHNQAPGSLALFAEIEARMSALPGRFEAAAPELGSAEVGALQALGYAGAGAALGLGDRPPFAELPDTYAQRPLIERMDALALALAARDFPAVAAELRALVELDPANAQFQERLGEVLLQFGAEHLAEAERALTAALTLRPGRARVHLGLARCAQLQGELERAEAELRTALLLEPNSPTALYNLGFVLAARAESSKDLQEERRMYREVLELLDRALAALPKDAPESAALAETRANVARRLELAGGGS